MLSASPIIAQDFNMFCDCPMFDAFVNVFGLSQSERRTKCPYFFHPLFDFSYVYGKFSLTKDSPCLN